MNTTIKPRCEVCADTGRRMLPGGERSDFLDCTAPGCDAAEMLVAMGEWMNANPMWMPSELFLHGRAVERIASAASPAAPAADDLLEVVRTLCAIAARMRELPDEKRHFYPSPTAEGSPVLAAARAACVARGYTADGLAVPGVEYPATAPVADAAIPEGWKLVPIEPTDAMVLAPGALCTTGNVARIHREVWRRMLEAAPTCTVPPAGWTCTRAAGHDGPCAALPAAPAPGSAQ